MRRALLVVPLLGALIVLAGCGSGRGEAARRAQWIGFNDISIGYRLATPQTDAELSATAGARVARVTLDWRQIEPARGRFEWGPYDALHTALRGRGIRLLPVLVFAPRWTWAPGSSCGPATSWCAFPPAPEHDPDWARFVTAAARRYPDAVAIEVWNEPNLHGFWGPAPDAARYARLLEIARNSVRALSRSTPVLLGGLGTGPPGSGDVTAEQFLSDVQAAGASETFDGVGVHLYPGAGGAATVPALLGPIRRATGKPIWVTELGVSTAGPPDRRAALEQAQATGLDSIVRALRGTHDVAAIIVHTLIDRPGQPEDPESGYGVVRTDLSPKPAFCRVGAAFRGGTQPSNCAP